MAHESKRGVEDVLMDLPDDLSKSCFDELLLFKENEFSNWYDELMDAHFRERRGSVELPKDKDGVPIHAGDVLDGYGKTIEVVEMRHGRSGWVLISRDGNGYADTFAFTHHHAPTVEDVLREFAYGLGVPVADSYVAATAAKLRLAGDGE